MAPDGTTIVTSSKPKHHRIPLAWLLSGVFGGLTAISVLVVLWMGLAGMRITSADLLGTRTAAIVDNATEQVDRLLRPIEVQGRWLAAEVASGELNPADSAQWASTVEAVVSATPQVFGVVTIDHRGTGYIRSDLSDELIVRDWSRQPEMANFMARFRAMAPGSIEWGQPLLSRELDPPQPMLVLRLPLYRNGEFWGPLMLTVSLSELSRTLVEEAADGTLVPFILYDRKWVLAHPTLVRSGEIRLRPVPADNISVLGGGALTPVNELGDNFLSGLASAVAVNQRIVAPVPNASILFKEVDEIETAYVIREINRYGPRPWIIGTYFDTSIGDDVIERLFGMGIAGGAVFLVSLVIAVLLGRRAAKPAQGLAVAARGVQEGDLGETVHVPRTRIYELDLAGQSFNNMVAGLRERERIRDQFGRFVPEAVAAAILAEDGDLTPTTTEATVLFTDIEKFTTVAEGLQPEEVVGLLNEYFSAAVEILERHNGVITQFQGDAILATFNVPAPDPQHAANAVSAAIELQRLMAGRTFAGLRLGIRIGVNTGLLVAGNVGAAGRLNYTVHGDAVNLAARLEQVNKEHGTRIIVADSTVHEAPGFPYRELGSVTVRGKENPVVISTVEPSAWGA